MNRLLVPFCAFAIVFAAANAALAQDANAEREAMRKQLVDELDKRLGKLRTEMVEVIDKMLDAKYGAQKTDTKPTPEVKPEPVPDKPKAYLGVYVRELTEKERMLLDLRDNRGLLVTLVHEGHSAHKGGMKELDIILEADGKAVGSSADLGAVLKKCEVGQKVKFRVLRDGAAVDVTVTLATKDGTTGTTDNGTDTPAAGDNKELSDRLAKAFDDAARKQKEASETKRDTEKKAQEKVEVPVKPADSDAKSDDKGAKAFKDNLAALQADPVAYIKKRMGASKAVTALIHELFGKDWESVLSALPRTSELFAEYLQLMDEADGKQSGKPEKKETSAPSEKKKSDTDKELKKLLEDLNDPEKIEAPRDKGRLGVRVQEGETGVKIIEVSDGSAAADAGLKVDDVVISINGVKVAELANLSDGLKGKYAGDTVEIEVRRATTTDSETLKLKVTLKSK